MVEKAKYKNLGCSRCGDVMRVSVGGLIVFFGSPVTARASGLGSICRECRLVFCSRHAVWHGMDGIPSLPGDVMILSPHCPECGAMMGGLDS
jgi:hypothetical protein